MRTGLTIAALYLALAGCGDGQQDGAANAAAEAANAAAPGTAESEPAAAAEAPSRRSYTLAANGIEPGLTFGMKQADALAAARAAFGPGGKAEHNDECGEGPMDFVSFRGLQLGFQDGKLAGW